MMTRAAVLTPWLGGEDSLNEGETVEQALAQAMVRSAGPFSAEVPQARSKRAAGDASASNVKE